MGKMELPLHITGIGPQKETYQFQWTLKRVKFGTVGRENNIIVIEKNFMK